MKRQLAILGSTGSIGTQALEVVEMHPDMFEIYALTANNQVDLLIKQAKHFMPEVVVIANESKYPVLKEALENLPIKVWTGSDAISQVVQSEPIDLVLTAMVGYSGLQPTIAAIKAGKAIALANKETLVVAGELITKLAKEHEAPLLPVDSEHSAIFQCLSGNWNNPIEKVILTASGGPFLSKTLHEMSSVTKEEALNHPNWVMGPKVTIDSASMMNKGFEMIEAKWLFDLTPEQIEVVVHPQSIVHSMVQFHDGSVMAQLGIPDMKLPIAYAFSYPHRLKSPTSRLELSQYATLTFETPDMNRFPNLGYAYEAIRKGGNMPCILNAANELVVDAFLNEKILFSEMSPVIEQAMQQVTFIEHPTYDDIVQSDRECRNITFQLIR